MSAPAAPPKKPSPPAVPKAEPDKAETGKAASKLPEKQVPEIGGPSGPEPTRYGDWERKGRCIDF